MHFLWLLSGVAHPLRVCEMFAVWQKQQPPAVAPRNPDPARPLSMATGLSVESGLGTGHASRHPCLSPRTRSFVPCDGIGSGKLKRAIEIDLPVSISTR